MMKSVNQNQIIMKTIITYLLLVLLTFSVNKILAQEDEILTAKIALLEKKKKDVETIERDALKIAVELIMKREESGEISKDEAKALKLAVAEKHAKNIQNKQAILQNTIELLQRGGTDNLNTEMSRIEIAFGGDDSKGDVLFGVKYNSGKQEKVIYDRRTYGDPVIAFGLNNALIENQSLEDSPYKIGGSRFFEIGWAWRTRVFKNSNFLRLHYGASFQFNGLKPKDNQYFVVNDGQAELETFDLDLNKSKFRMDNLVFPVHFEFGPSKLRETENSIRYSLRNKFRIGLGGYAGFNVGTRQKLKYSIDGDRVKDKLKRGYNTSSFVYGLSGYVGFDGVQLYAKYDLSPIFKNAAVEQRNISLGVRFDLD